MNPINRSNLLERSIGREAIPIDRLAEIAGVSETQVRGWADGSREPRASHMQAMIDSPLLPAEFKKQLADSLFPPKCGMRVEFCDDTPVAESPMRITINLDEELCKIQKYIDRYTHIRSEGGRYLTGAEAEDIRGLIATFKKATNELESALKGATLGSRATG
jgi:hypothetical protein